MRWRVSLVLYNLMGGRAKWDCINELEEVADTHINAGLFHDHTACHKAQQLEAQTTIESLIIAHHRQPSSTRRRPMTIIQNSGILLHMSFVPYRAHKAHKKANDHGMLQGNPVVAPRLSVLDLGRFLI